MKPSRTASERGVRWGLRFGVFLVLGIWSLKLPALRAAETNNERHLIAILQSTASLHDKDAACARLKRIGTKESVSALSALLADEQLSQSARYALESLPGPEVDRALIAALAHTSGSTEVGIINSIAVRADKHALSPLEKLLKDKDPMVAAAAAHALGRIGDSTALKALSDSLPNSEGELHRAEVQAVLECAEVQLQTGHESKALSAFEMIYRNEKSGGFRAAAYRGAIRSAGKKSGALIMQALSGEPGPAQLAAMQMLHESDLPGIATDLAGMAPKFPPQIQVSLIDGRTQAGDRSIVAVASALTGSANDEVRLSAIKCLGSLGNESAIPPLATRAASAKGSERNAAQDALVRLHYGKITEALLAQLKTGEPAVRGEAARALGRRGDSSAVPPLIELASRESGNLRTAALQSISLLAGPSHIGAVVQLVVQANTDDTRSEAAETLNSVLQRLGVRHEPVNLSSVTQALEHSPPEVRVDLVGVYSNLKSAESRSALRAVVQDANPKVQTAAVRAMCDTADADLLPDLLGLVRTNADEKLRTLAIGACVRLTTQEDTAKLTNAARLEVMKAILASPLDVSQKRLVLSGLAEIPDIESLKLTESMLDDSTVQPEAIRAVIKIGASLITQQPEPAREALQHVLRLPIDDETRKITTAALNKSH